MSKVIFSADGLSFSIGTQQLLDNTGMTVHEGERIALVGRNGAGKSTFLRIITGEEIISEGQNNLYKRPAHEFSEAGFFA